jgi:glycosyltransferase involved in cell wall biosynthesis
VEDVLAAQVARGHEVAYFFAGRYLPGGRPPHLRRWRRGSIEMLELYNSRTVPGLDAGTLDPETDIAEPAAEAAFRTALDRVRPDVVHVQELIGLPSSLLTIPRERGIPVVLSVEDYQLLCPTLKLFDANGELCRRGLPGAMCAVCCRQAPPDESAWVRATLIHVALRSERTVTAARNASQWLRHRSPVAAAAERWRALRPAPVPDGDRAPASRTAEPAAYDRRRLINAARMSEVDAVLAMSHRVAEMCAERGVAHDRLRVLHFTLSHIANLRPTPRVDPGEPMTFVVLNGCASVAKGVDVVLEALRALADAGLSGRFRLDVWGFVARWRRDELEANADVRLRGNYTPAALADALAEADVGIVPSVWEEAYAYTGPEMLAAGVPVIGSARGGITDYVVPGETGWLNRSAGAAELAETMGRLIRGPEEVARLRARLRAQRPPAAKPMGRHVDELDGVYAELMAA